MKKMFTRLIPEDIEMITMLEKDLGNIKADAGYIEQVIMNLVVNARDAMENGGTLTLKTQNVILHENYFFKYFEIKESPYVLLSISDTGCGMSDEIKEGIFEPFFTTKKKGKGTGFGLSTVYGIVHQSDGHILVESEPKQGTIIKTYFPKVDKKVSDIEKLESQSDKLLGEETVLIVEDQNEVLQFTKEIFDMHRYNVLDSIDVNKALKLCEGNKNKIKLIIADVLIPIMSGIQLVKEVKK